MQRRTQTEHVAGALPIQRQPRRAADVDQRPHQRHASSSGVATRNTRLSRNRVAENTAHAVKKKNSGSAYHSRRVLTS